MNPTARSKQYLEKRGFTVCKVEQRIKFPVSNRPGVEGSILRDAFGFGDLLYMGHGIIGLCQSTSGQNKASRVQKILGLSEARKWLECGGKILVHGWAKRGPKGKRKLWSAGESTISLPSIKPNTPLHESDMAFMERPSDLLPDTPNPRHKRGKSNPDNQTGLFTGV